MEGANRGARSQEDEAARFLAQQWELEYRETHTLSLDPSVLGILDAAEARRLEALPLEIDGDRPVFAVAEPTVDRLAAVRAAAGEHASFVVVSRTALDALLSSKVFNPGTPDLGYEEQLEPVDQLDPAAAVVPEALPSFDAPPEPFPAAETEPEDPSRHDGWPGSDEADDERAGGDPPRYGSPTDRDEGRADRTPPLEPSRQQEPQTPPRPVLVAVGSDSSDESRVETLVRQINATGTMLAAQVGELSAALEETQSQLRLARDQLERARIENTQSRASIQALGDELAASRAMSQVTTTRLRELVTALEGSTSENEDVEAPDPYASRTYEANSRIA